jgi:hypothetical protein
MERVVLCAKVDNENDRFLFPFSETKRAGILTPKRVK